MGGKQPAEHPQNGQPTAQDRAALFGRFDERDQQHTQTRRGDHLGRERQDDAEGLPPLDAKRQAARDHQHNALHKDGEEDGQELACQDVGAVCRRGEETRQCAFLVLAQNREHGVAAGEEGKEDHLPGHGQADHLRQRVGRFVLPPRRRDEQQRGFIGVMEKVALKVFVPVAVALNPRGDLRRVRLDAVGFEPFHDRLNGDAAPRDPVHHHRDHVLHNRRADG